MSDNDTKEATSPIKGVIGLLLLLANAYRHKTNSTVLLNGLHTYLPLAQEYFKTAKLRWPKPQVQALLNAIQRGKNRDPEFYYGLLRELYKANQVGPRLKRKVTADHTVDYKLAKLFQAAIALYSLKDPSNFEKTESRLLPLLAYFGSQTMRALWRRPIMPQTQVVSKLKTVVGKLTGTPDTHIPFHTAQELRDKKPEQYKLYLKLRQEANKQYQAGLRTLVHDSNKPTLPVPQARRDLEAAGITIHPLSPALDKLHIGEDNKLYTPVGKRLNAFPTPGSKIIYNQDYNPHRDDQWVLRYQIPGGKTEQWAYTEDYRKKAAQQKYAKVEGALDKLPTAKTEWRRELFSKNRDTRAFGAMMELLYIFAARVGAAGNEADGKPTYGLTTLQVRHIKFYKNGDVVISYPGKKGTAQKHVIHPGTDIPNQIIRVIKELIANKGNTDYVFTRADGSRITADDLNKHIKQLGLDVTGHKFRHMRSTLLFRKLDAEHPLPASADQRKAEDHFKELVQRIGAVLGHQTGNGKVPFTTALKAYLDPRLAVEWFTKHHKRVPAFVAVNGTSD